MNSGDAHSDRAPAEQAAEGEHAHWRPHLHPRLPSDLCERCGTSEHVHRGLCQRCRQLMVEERERVEPDGGEHPHQAPRVPLHNPPGRPRGA